MKPSYNFILKISQEITKDIKIKPGNFYYNAQKCKSIIYNQNKGLSGIYRWNNLITGETYVGSALDLRKRLSAYYSLANLKSKLPKVPSNNINSALLNYLHSNFSLDILEYCPSDKLISREQYYMDKLNPEYNIFKKAGSPLGAKHTEEAKLLMKKAATGRKLTEETKLKIRESMKLRRGKDTSWYGKFRTTETKLKISVTKSIFIKVQNIEQGTFKIFTGNKQVANYLGIGLSTLTKYKKLNKLINNKYLVSNS